MSNKLQFVGLAGHSSSGRKRFGLTGSDYLIVDRRVGLLLGAAFAQKARVDGRVADVFDQFCNRFLCFGIVTGDKDRTALIERQIDITLRFQMLEIDGIKALYDTGSRQMCFEKLARRRLALI